MYKFQLENVQKNKLLNFRYKATIVDYIQFWCKMIRKVSGLATLDKCFDSKTIRIDSSLDQRQKIMDYFLKTWQLYEKLYELIADQSSFYIKPEPLRHPLIFYYGHTATFYVNKFLEAGIITNRINQSFQFMFAVGVDEMDWDDLNETHYDWPKLHQVKDYRRKVKKMVLNTIPTLDPKISWESKLWMVLMGIEHERIHLQTSAVIIRRLPIDRIRSIEEFVECPSARTDIENIPKNRMVHVEAFEESLSNAISDPLTYGWDNEFGNHQICVQPFEAAEMLVSNGEYKEFVRDGGYIKMQYWTGEGQAWLKSTKAKQPIFWLSSQNQGGEAKKMLKTLCGVREMPWDWPVEVNNLEAQAFCVWKSQKVGKKYRLPTEDQYCAIRDQLKQDQISWEYQSVGNINLQYWFSPNPVDMFKIGGFFDIVGNVWQHTITPIRPFEGFEIHPNYQDFTTPTFDDRHDIMKGGSFISSGAESIKRSRYAFRRHFYQFSGFRYVISDNPVSLKHSGQQSDAKVQEAIRDHYVNKDSYIMESKRLIESYLKEHGHKCNRSLSIGCSVGRIPFQMAKHFKESFGIDYTARFFQIATRLCESGQVSYRKLSVNFEDFDFKKNSVTFYQFNPENPDPKKLGLFDFIFVDGFTLRDGTLLNVLKKAQRLMLSSGCTVAIVMDNQKESLKKEELGSLSRKWVESKEAKSFGMDNFEAKSRFTLCFYQVQP